MCLDACVKLGRWCLAFASVTVPMMAWPVVLHESDQLGILSILVSPSTTWFAENIAATDAGTAVINAPVSQAHTRPRTKDDNETADSCFSRRW